MILRNKIINLFVFIKYIIFFEIIYDNYLNYIKFVN